MKEPLLYKGDRICLSASFLKLLQERPDYYDRYIVILESVIDDPEGKILVVHNESK